MSLAFFTNPVRALRLGRDERMLARATKAGDRQAFDELVTTHRADVARFLAYRLPQPDVEDVLQETFIAAWQARAKYDFSSTYRTWLIGIAINKSRDRNRSNRRDLGNTSLESAEQIQTQPNQLRAETSVVLSEALAQLSERDQEIIHLYYGAGLNLREIANVTETNLNTLKYRFYNAHRQLLESLNVADMEAYFNG